jgi:putative salt-induced outer membrane protein
MRRFLIFVAFTTVLGEPVFAQNPPAPPAPPDPLTGQVALGYVATSGNTESTSTNGTFGLQYARPVWSHDVKLAAIGATTDNVTTAEAYAAGYKARRAFEGSKSYLFTALDWRKNRFSSYEEELSETVGYGRRLVENGPHTLNGEIGIGARQAQLIDGTEEDEGIIRGSLEYEWKFTDTTGFKQSLLIQSGDSNTSTEAISELRARLVGNIGMVLSYRVKHNSHVVLGTEPTDRFTSIQLEYAF